jgi:hypothetical protein
MQANSIFCYFCYIGVIPWTDGGTRTVDETFSIEGGGQAIHTYNLQHHFRRGRGETTQFETDLGISIIKSVE